jgi:hypothetical protein
VAGYSVFDVLLVGLWNIPGLVLGVLAVVLAVVRRLTGRARSLLVAGGVALVVAEIASVAWLLFLPSLYLDREFDEVRVPQAVGGAVVTLIHLTALALFVAAALAGRQQPAPAAGAGPWPGFGPRPDAGPPTGPSAGAGWWSGQSEPGPTAPPDAALGTGFGPPPPAPTAPPDPTPGIVYAPSPPPPGSPGSGPGIGYGPPPSSPAAPSDAALWIDYGPPPPGTNPRPDTGPPPDR